MSVLNTNRETKPKTTVHDHGAPPWPLRGTLVCQILASVLKLHFGAVVPSFCRVQWYSPIRIAGVKKAASGTVVKRPSVNAPQNSELSTAASVLSMPACSVA